jgi:DNA polymerase III alpha subunit
MTTICPIVATNEPYFASPDDFEAHDALICIARRKLCRRGPAAAPEP